MDDLLHMFEVLDTSKSGAISAKDLSKFLLLIKKMRNFDFDLKNSSKMLVALTPILY